jgi:hypothetical protein
MAVSIHGYSQAEAVSATLVTRIADVESRPRNFHFQGGTGAVRVDQMERIIDRGYVYILFRAADNHSVAIGRYLGIYSLEEFVFHFFLVHIVVVCLMIG